MSENTNEYSTKHPHEPEIPATYDDEGRCLICVLLVQVTQLEAENEALHILRDVVDWSIKPHRERYQEGAMKCELCEAWEKYSRKIALLTGVDDD